VEERGAAVVPRLRIEMTFARGLGSVVRDGGKARIRALEAMWRSLWEPYAKYFPPHLTTRIQLLRHAIRGAGYFQSDAICGQDRRLSSIARTLR
jgi:hypothetical protein